MERVRRLVWRVRAQDGRAYRDAFDAAVLPARFHTSPPSRQMGLDLPHESEQADEPLTLIVRAHANAPPIIVECEIVAADGAVLSRGWSTNQEAVIIRSPAALVVTGLPEGEPDPFAPTTSRVAAVGGDGVRSSASPALPHSVGQPYPPRRHVAAAGPGHQPARSC